MPNVVIPTGGVGVVKQGAVDAYTNPSAPSSGIIYVSTGERWDSIAYKMYGDPTQVQPLIQNNPGITISDIVPSGAKVFVPLVTPTVASTTSTPWE